jgi:biotin synthase-related radical SAM superfamily protein
MPKAGWPSFSQDLSNHMFSAYSDVKSLSGVCSTNLHMTQYFYKVSKTILHKLSANSGINIFYNKCVYKYYLQLL